MYTHHDVKLVVVVHRFVGASTIVVCLSGVAVLLGWQFDIELLKRLAPRFVAMNPVTAVAFILAAASLFLQLAQTSEIPRPTSVRAIIGSYLGVVLMVIGALNLLDSWFQLNLGIDQLLFHEKLSTSLGAAPNRMAPNTALSFCFIGFALMLLKRGTGNKLRLSDLFAFASFAIALFAVIGYVFVVKPFYTFLHFIPMSLHTALLLLLLSTAILYTYPEDGVSTIFISRSSGGVIARRLLPAMIALPILLGWLRLQGEAYGLYPREFGIAFHTTATIVLLVTIIWWNALRVDRTDRKRELAENESEEIRTFLDSIIENIPNMIFVKDAKDLRFVRFNKSGEQLLGISREEMLGKSDYDFFPKDEADFFTTNDREVLERKQLVDIAEEQIQTKNRGIRILHTRKIPLLDARGNPLHLLGISEDITDRKRAEELLRESEVRYRTLFDSIDEGYCIIQMIFDEQDKPVDYRFLVINPSFERQTGLRDALGKRMRELAPNHEEHWFDIYGRIALTGEPARFENRAEQLHRWYDVYAFRFGEPEDRQVAILFNDITERKQAAEALQHSNAQLEAANKELETFSYSVSHDLRAPLRHIDGFADLLSKKAFRDLDSTSQHYLSTISTSAKFMGQLIDDLLVFSRMSRSDIKRSVINPYSVIHEVIQQLNHETSNREIKWTIHPLPMVSADPMMLHLIFQNLIGNAVKYTRPRPAAEIEVGCKKGPGQFQFYVSDNGVGFDMKYVDKLFGVFQRLHRSDEFEGTGIGLASVQRIVHRHGGQTWAESTLGKGSTFSFSIPSIYET